MYVCMYVYKVSEGDEIEWGRSTSAHNRPFSAVPRNSVTKACPPRQIPPWRNYRYRPETNYT